MGGFASDTALGGLMTGLKALFCLTAVIMFGGKANMPALLFGGTLFGVGGNDGDCGKSEGKKTHDMRI